MFVLSDILNEKMYCLILLPSFEDLLKNMKIGFYQTSRLLFPYVNMKNIENIGSVVHHTSALPPMYFSLAIKKITMPPSHFSMIKNAL